MIICGPFHSVCNPPVGMAYLKSYLQASGIACSLHDLNILSRRFLLDAAFAPGFIDRMYSQSSRTYLAEAVVWSWHEPDGPSALIHRTVASGSEALIRFWQEERLEDLTRDPEVVRFSEVLRAWLDEQVDRLMAEVQRWAGFSTTITNLPVNLYMAKRFKAHDPGLLVIMGGPEVTHRNAKEMLDSFPYLDAVIPPPAFEPLATLLKNPEALRDGPVPTGVWCRDGEGIVRPAIKQAEPFLDGLPYADWDGIDLGAYDPGFIVKDLVSVDPYYPVVPLHTSQGCSYNQCDFCYNIALYPHYASQSSERVLAEIRHQIEAVGSRGFFFTDFEFNGSVNRLMDICRLIQETFADPIRFYVWLRIDKINRFMLEAIHDAGCQQVFIGLEAVDDHILRLMNKGYNSALALKKLELLNDFQMETPLFHYEFNLIKLYPGETLASVKNTLATVAENYPLFYKKVTAVVPFMLHEGTPAFLGINSKVTGCMSSIFPPGVTLRSYRYVIDAPDDATLADREELWDAVNALASRVS